jgi:hypothetical protein
MATDLLDIADRLWRGEADMDQRHLFGMGGALADLGGDNAFVAAFSNVAAFSTAEGMVLVDRAAVPGRASARRAATGAQPLAHRGVHAWAHRSRLRVERTRPTPVTAALPAAS